MLQLRALRTIHEQDVEPRTSRRREPAHLDGMVIDLFAAHRVLQQRGKGIVAQHAEMKGPVRRRRSGRPFDEMREVVYEHGLDLLIGGVALAAARPGVTAPTSQQPEQQLSERPQRRHTSLPKTLR